MAAGYNSIGIVSSGGAGMALAQWIADGEPPFDLWEVDIRRVQPFQRNRRYLKARVTETLGLLYADHFPYRQVATRPRRAALAAARAPQGTRRRVRRDRRLGARQLVRHARPAARISLFLGPAELVRQSARRASWRCAHGVGLFDMSSFGKIRVEGRDALRRPAAALRQRCRRACRAGSSIRRCSTSAAASKATSPSRAWPRRPSCWSFPQRRCSATSPGCSRHLGEAAAVVTDISAAEAVLCLMGPQTRAVLAAASPNDFSNANNPFGTCAGNRDRHGPRARPPRHLCRRARLGALRVDATRRRMCSRPWSRPGPRPG